MQGDVTDLFSTNKLLCHFYILFLDYLGLGNEIINYMRFLITYYPI